VVGAHPTAQDHEDYIGPASPLHPAGGEDSLVVRVEHYLEQQPGVVGFLASLIVVVFAFKAFQSDPTVDEVIDGVFQRTGKQLLLQIDRHHQILSAVVILEASHVCIQTANALQRKRYISESELIRHPRSDFLVLWIQRM